MEAMRASPWSGSDIRDSPSSKHRRECQIRTPRVAYICQWSFDSNIRKVARGNGMRMLELDHWLWSLWMSPRPDLGPWPHLGYAAQPHRTRGGEAHRRRRVARARNRRRRALVRGGRRTGRAAQVRRRVSIRCSSAPQAHDARRRHAHRLPRPHGRRAAFRAGDRAGGDRSAQEPRRLRGHRSAHDRGARHGRGRAPAAARRRQVAAALACAASLLLQLRRGRPGSSTPDGGATARPARCSISRAPIRS